MIESTFGIERLPDMLEGGGIDAILVGPHDLSISLGIPEQYDHLRFVAAIERIIETCQRYQTAVGMHFIFGTVEQALAWIQRGFTFVSYRGDTLFTALGIQRELGWLREQLGSPALQPFEREIGASGHAK
jgi:4-hydroxy-2-oxoheptanedioate aldolase